MTPPLPPDDLVPDCGRVRGELAGLVYDELPPDSRSALERHLADCAACREEWTALRDTRRVLSCWEAPAAEEDPRALARSIAAQARPGKRPDPRRARLVRWSAILSAAAAAGLFLLSLLHARASFDQGRFELSFGWPGTSAPAPQRTGQGEWRDEMQSIAAQEVALRLTSFEESQAESLQRLTLMTREELLRLAQAVDSALAQKQESWDARLMRLGQEARQADLETRRVLTDLVNYLPASQTSR